MHVLWQAQGRAPEHLSAMLTVKVDERILRRLGLLAHNVVTILSKVQDLCSLCLRVRLELGPRLHL